MTAELFTLDTNILVYAADQNAGEKHGRACDIVERAARRNCILTVQALAEFFHAVTREGIVPMRDASEQVRDWISVFPTIPADAETLGEATQYGEPGGVIQFWDAMLLMTAHRAGCAFVLTEDMYEGEVIESAEVLTRILNPFAEGRNIETVDELLGG